MELWRNISFSQSKSNLMSCVAIYRDVIQFSDGTHNFLSFRSSVAFSEPWWQNPCPFQWAHQCPPGNWKPGTRTCRKCCPLMYPTGQTPRGLDRSRWVSWLFFDASRTAESCIQVGGWVLLWAGSTLLYFCIVNLHWRDVATTISNWSCNPLKTGTFIIA